MPRTKAVSKPKREQFVVEESDLLVKDFEHQVKLRIMKMDAEAKMAMKSLETFVDVTLSRLTSEIQQMTLGELLALDLKDQDCNEVSSSVDDSLLPPPPTTVKAKKAVKRITAASDDGYVTEGVGAVKRMSRAKKANIEPKTVQRTQSVSRANKATAEPRPTRRTRSSSRNNTEKLSEINRGSLLKTVKKEKNVGSTRVGMFQTPAASNPHNNEYGLVTPKVKPNAPLNVLRRPRQGEMAMSMQGSPLLVSAVVKEDTANINVPLQDGNVMCLLPNYGLRMSNIPALDPETIKQLETLRSHIEKVISYK